ncbi:hypothetical protein [Argonema galeatum]|uniref:hypothetical protein n=1 Tax=Argonema galeatum TaxID=2942762 RepID=UPI00201320FB|nr:hypothetical protein [Argonema galeatum]MCL1468657.1 hypothetical protein [Argonema galeatum A003/A1]
MSPSNRPPAPLRYFKARLRPLFWPMVWGTATIISLVGFSTWAYFTHPEWLVFSDDRENTSPINTVEPTVSDEDKAIGADIDTLSVLEKDLANSEPFQVAPAETEKQQGLFDDFIKRKEAADAQKSSGQSSITNPFAIKSQDPLNNSGTLPSGNSITTPSSNLGAGTTANPAGSPNSAPLSPLQSALDRIDAGKQPTLQNPTTAPASPLQSALDRLNTGNTIATPAPTDKLGQNSGSNQTPTQSTSGIPGQVTAPAQQYPGTAGYSSIPGQSYGSASPVPGTTGYNVPPTSSSNPPNSYTYLNQPQAVPGVPPAAQVSPSLTPSNLGQSPFQNATPGNGYANPGYNSNFGNPAAQPSQVQSPPNFSVPRAIPGQNIGGGQINTFSNP